MDVLNLFKYGLWRISERLCTKHNIYILVKGRTGIKDINISPMSVAYGVDDTNSEIFKIRPEKLFLGPDFLKDAYTLIDCCIMDSPHYGLMKTIRDGGDITKSDYYIRFTKGELDSRHYQRKRAVSYFIDKYKIADTSIKDDTYKPVKVYTWKGRYYIYDGKHRAALCALKNEDVKCIIIYPICGPKMSQVDREIYRIMAGEPHYVKHIKFISDGEE